MRGLLIASLMMFVSTTQAATTTTVTAGDGKSSWTVTTDGSLRMRSISVVANGTGLATGNVWVIAYLPKSNLQTPFLNLNSDGSWSALDGNSFTPNANLAPAVKSADLTKAVKVLDVSTAGVTAKSAQSVTFNTITTDSTGKTSTSSSVTAPLPDYLLRLLSNIDASAVIYVGVGSDWKSMTANKTYALVGNLAWDQGAGKLTDTQEVNNENLVKKIFVDGTFVRDQTKTGLKPFVRTVTGIASTTQANGSTFLLDQDDNIWEKSGDTGAYFDPADSCVETATTSPRVTCYFSSSVNLFARPGSEHSL